jgi:transcriptional regulator with XRE-family HTH domain
MAKETNIGERIRSIREKRQMSASELARLVHVTPTAVWNWENSGTRPRQGALSSIARVLGVTNDFLLSGNAEAAPSGETVAEIIEEARSKIAKTTGFALERVKLHVELQPNEDRTSAGSKNGVA